MRTSLSGENEDEQVGRADSGLHLQNPRTAFFGFFLLAILGWGGRACLEENEDEQVGLR
jgi:hypothetical protein